MLQMINPSGQATLAGPGGDALPAGFAQAISAKGEAPTFDLQLAQRGFSVAAQPLPEALPAVPAEVSKRPEDSTEADAEQWLLSMLDQQAVRIEAREGAAQSGDDIDVEAQPADGETGDLPLLPLMASREDAASAPARQLKPAASGQKVLPAAANGVLTQAQLSMFQQPQLPPSGVVPDVAALPAQDVSPLEGALDRSLLERLPATGSEADASVPASTAHTQPSTQTHGVERALKLHAPQAQWGEQMLHSLRENVELQINQRIQSATIRLDPPELGSLEIYLSHESGRLSVQLSAANADVARLLQQTSDRLRQELVGQNFVQVNVQVSADAQGGRQQGQSPRQAWLGEESIQAASSTVDADRSHQDSTSDVLVTV